MRKLFKAWKLKREISKLEIEIEAREFAQPDLRGGMNDLFRRVKALEKGRGVDSEHFTTFLDRHQERIEALEVVTGLHHD